MISIPAAILTGERARETVPLSKAKISKSHLSFVSFANNATGQIAPTLPLTVCPAKTGPSAYVAYRSISGQLWLKATDTTNASDFTHPTTGVTEITGTACIRPGLFMDSFDNPILFDVISSGGGFQVRSANLFGTSNAVAVSWSNYGPSGWGDAFSNTSSLVRRVEAVCPTDGGCIVAVGTHDYTNKRSTVRFFWVTTDFVVALSNMYQLSFDETYTGWQFASHHTAYICAIWDPSARRFSVIANDQIHGHAVTFQVQQGIESVVRPVLYVSGEAANIGLFPYSIMYTYGVFYLVAGFRRRVDVGTVKVNTIEYDCYLQSANGVDWSFGELSSFIATGHKGGHLMLRRDGSDVIVYVGRASALTASPTFIQAPGKAGTEYVLDDYLDAWGTGRATNAANAVDVQLSLPATGGPLADSNFIESAILTLEAGFDGVTTPVGVFALDSAEGDITPEGGSQLIKVKGRDLASWKLIEYAAPMAFDLQGRVIVDVAKQGWNTLRRMTPDRGVRIDGNGYLQYYGLNDPYLALCETDESGDVTLKVQVNTYGADTNCLGVVGFVFGMSQGGDGHILMLPRATTWNPGGGKMPTGASMRRLTLQPIDSTEPDKAGTGWNLNPRVNPVRVSASSIVEMTVGESGTFRVGNTFSLANNKTYDLVFILRGRRAQVYAKEAINGSTTWAAGAAYTLVCEYLFDHQQQRSQFGRDYSGLLLTTDVFVDNATFAGAVEKDIEAGITNAREITSALHTYDDWAYVDCGVVSATVESGAKRIVTNPQQLKLARLVRGRALIVTQDNQASFPRRVKTDGLRHYLQEGDVSGFGFPGVNPLPVGVTNYGGSDPASWRIVLHHGYLFSGDASLFDLPTSGDMIVDNEIIGYAPATFDRRAAQGQQTWTEVPTFYWILAAKAEGGSDLSMWWNGSGQVGDDMHGISMVGMLAEIISQNGKSNNDKTQFYVTAFSEAATPASGNTDTVTLDHAYEPEVRDIAVGAGDLACFSWRGKYGTTKTTHEATAPVCYFPRNTATTSEPISFFARRFEAYSGRYQSTEDLLRRVCALAGVRDLTFKTRTNSDAPITFNNTNRQQLTLSQNVANFCMDAAIWIPGNGNNAAGTAGITGASRFQVLFRGRYRIALGSYATAADRTAGCHGVLRIGLLLETSEINADSNGDRWLEVATVPITDYVIGGATTGSGTAWSYTADATRRTDFRLIVQGPLISVELNGQPVWTFNLNNYTTQAGASLRFDDAGSIEPHYTVTPPTHATTFFVRELGEEAGRFLFGNGASASAAISSIAQTRKLQWRSTPLGGMTFSRFSTRGNVGTISDNLWHEAYSREGLVQRTHHLVKGSSVGEALDVGEIAAHGYRYASTDAQDVNTPEAAQLEAQLLMTQEAEQSLLTTMEGIALFEAEAEDQIGISYTGAGNSPAHAASQHVINNLSFKGGRTLEGSYTLRRLIS